jgi:Lon protease-like protein
VAEPAELAMFPLGGVLFPSVVLPLHVFEPRYRELVRHLLGGDVEPEFGVVLISRGSEVGGSDTRTSVGTVARIAEAAELPDGRWALATFGVRRIRVVEWLEDDPWPRALVEDLADRPAADEAAAQARWAALRVGVRRTLGLAAELGGAPAAATIELADEPALGTFQAAAVTPVGPADEQLVLEAEGVDDRLDLLEVMVADQAELLEAQLRMG